MTTDAAVAARTRRADDRCRAIIATHAAGGAAAVAAAEGVTLHSARCLVSRARRRLRVQAIPDRVARWALAELVRLGELDGVVEGAVDARAEAEEILRR